MKRMTLRDVQAVSLEILKEFHSFCLSNNLNYSLAFGTAIGAIRHKGFIPWDDDLDVVMPRPDFEKLIDCYKAGDYSLVSPYEKGSSLAYARLCDMKKTRVKSALSFCDRPTGVWIDIFPLDGLSEIEEDHSYRYWNKLLPDWEYLQKLRMQKADRFWKRTGVLDKWHWIKQYIPNIDKKIRIKQMGFIQEIKSIKYNESSYCGEISCCMARKIQRWPKSWFETTVVCEFEGQLFNICQKYDLWLNDRYGDYMQLPPEDQQKPSHNVHQYFWI